MKLRLPETPALEAKSSFDIWGDYLHFFSAALFAVSVNLDNFMIGVAFGLKKVRIDKRNNFIIAFVSCLGTYFAMAAGRFLRGFVSEAAANTAGSLLLIFIGVWFVGVFLKQERQKKAPSSPLEELGRKETVIKTISIQETALLSLVLAVNNMGIGIGGSITGLSPGMTSACTLIFSFLFISLGQSLGKTRLPEIFGKYANLISGGIILALGVYEMFI